MKSSRRNQRAGGRTRVLCSRAWLLRGISSIPGVLRLNGSRITFIAKERGSAWDWQLRKLERVAGSPGFVESLKNGTTATLFDEPLTEIRAHCPWYYFSGGLVFQIRGQAYKVSFGKPASSSSDNDELKTVSTMRHVGKKWIRALTLE